MDIPSDIVASLGVVRAGERGHGLVRHGLSTNRSGSGPTPSAPHVCLIPLAKKERQMKELHVCAGLNACYQHGKSGTNACAGTGDCATVVNNNCHGNNDCRGQGGCGAGGSLGSQQTAPGENLCGGKGSCTVPTGGIDADRTWGQPASSQNLA